MSNTAHLGVPTAELKGWVTIVLELVGGLAVVMGAFVPWVSIPLADGSSGSTMPSNVTPGNEGERNGH